MYIFFFYKNAIFKYTTEVTWTVVVELPELHGFSQGETTRNIVYCTIASLRGTSVVTSDIAGLPD